MSIYAETTLVSSASPVQRPASRHHLCHRHRNPDPDRLSGILSRHQAETDCAGQTRGRGKGRTDGRQTEIVSEKGPLIQDHGFLFEYSSFSGDGNDYYDERNGVYDYADEREVKRSRSDSVGSNNR